MKNLKLIVITSVLILSGCFGEKAPKFFGQNQIVKSDSTKASDRRQLNITVPYMVVNKAVKDGVANQRFFGHVDVEDIPLEYQELVRAIAGASDELNYEVQVTDAQLVPVDLEVGPQIMTLIQQNRYLSLTEKPNTTLRSDKSVGIKLRANIKIGKTEKDQITVENVTLYGVAQPQYDAKAKSISLSALQIGIKPVVDSNSTEEELKHLDHALPVILKAVASEYNSNRAKYVLPGFVIDEKQLKASIKGDDYLSKAQGYLLDKATNNFEIRNIYIEDGSIKIALSQK